MTGMVPVSDSLACKDGPVIRTVCNDRLFSRIDYPVAVDLDAEVFDDALPIRTVPQRPGAKHYTGKYFSYTVGTFVQCESILEMKRAQIADSDPTVVDIRSQPFRLVGRRNRRVCQYTPDFALINRSGAVTIVEVKPKTRFDSDKVRRTLDWAERLFDVCGWSLQRWSLDPDDLLWKNITYLEGFHDPRLTTPEVTSTILEAVSEEPLRIEQLEAVVEQRISDWPVLPAIKHLIWNGQLAIDLAAIKLNPTAFVAFGSQNRPDYLAPDAVALRRHQLMGVVL
ncbi:TnsA-like heteromeric transposase endonuclease subunit [Gordonia sp. CPCC 206044]|uniref:TnsA-like heteromeric transposase endonuclease subunit n=1 Tax=Gordonia sp. CPCC 206044 TaxID=3140793 RepID=UPI003AF34E14